VPGVKLSSGESKTEFSVELPDTAELTHRVLDPIAIPELRSVADFRRAGRGVTAEPLPRPTPMTSAAAKRAVEAAELEEAERKRRGDLVQTGKSSRTTSPNAKGHV
jgi:hypothetical protein